MVNSPFVDIGGGTSDICLVQGYFPKPDDVTYQPLLEMLSTKFLRDDLNRIYPNNGSSTIVREIKEANGYVGRTVASRSMWKSWTSENRTP